MISNSRIIEDTFEVIRAYETYTNQRSRSDSGIYRESSLPHPLWHIRLAILTLVKYDAKNRSNPSQAIEALQVAWASLEKFVDDAHYEKIETGLKCEPGSEHHKAAEQRVSAINHRWMNAFDLFDQIVGDLIPDVASKSREQLINGLLQKFKRPRSNPE